METAGISDRVPEIRPGSAPTHGACEEEYYYGYRMIMEYDENGSPIYLHRPLTFEDLLEPAPARKSFRLCVSAGYKTC